MDDIILDPNTEMDCCEPQGAVKASESHSHLHRISHLKDTNIKHDSEILYSTDSGFGSTNSRLGSDVSERFQDLHLSQSATRETTIARVRTETTETGHVESDDRTVNRPQKRPAVEEDDIQLSSDAYEQDEEGDTPLIRAIIYQKEEVALKFIRYTPDKSLLNIRNYLGQTALIVSVLTRQVKICRALVVAGASVDIQGQDGNTALLLACKLRDFHCVQALTSPVAPVEIKNTLSPHIHRNPQELRPQLELKNYEGLTCIHLATFQMDLPLLRYLAGIGANIDVPDGKSGRTALHFAVEMNQFQLVQHLISLLKANIDAVTFDLCTPLHLAAGRGHVEIAYMLHGAGADTQLQNFEGQYACELTSDEDLQALLDPSRSTGVACYTFT